jgi:predicted thioesterase
MEIKIEPGITGIETMIVEKKDTAKHYGSGLAEVFATPALVALMENTAYKSIEPYLPEGFSSVGIQVNVSHKKASLRVVLYRADRKLQKWKAKRYFFH